MSINLREDLNDDVKKLIKKAFDVYAMDDRTVLFNNQRAIDGRVMGNIARVAGQPVTIEINEIGDRKEFGGIVYELDEKGWKKLPIGTKL